MGLFSKEKKSGIDISQRLAGKKVGTAAEGTEPVEETSEQTIPDNVVSMTKKVDVGGGKSVYISPGQNLRQLDTPEYVKRSFPTYSCGITEDWPSDTVQPAQVRSLSNGAGSILTDEPAAETPSAAEEPQETHPVAPAEAYEQPTIEDFIETTTDMKEVKDQVANEVVKDTIEHISKMFGQRILDEKNEEAFKKEVYSAIDDKLKDDAKKVPLEARPGLAKRVYNLIFGFGPLQQLFDAGYSEIMVSRYDNIFVEKDGKMMYTGIKFGSEEELQTLIKNICGRVGRTISVSSPMCDGEFKEDRSRFNAVLPPVAVDGAQLTIRRFPEKKLVGEDYIRFGSLDQKILDFLQLAIQAKWTTICSGGTGSGKTSLLNLVSNFLNYDPGLSVITIEDSLELRINHPNVRRKLTRKSESRDKSNEVTARALVKNALRERPDVIVIGEIRDGTMADYLRAAGSGHDGCLTTIHANNPQDLESQVVVLFMMADDYTLDADTIRRMYATSVDLVIQIKRYSDHVRRISQISHIVGYGDTAAEELGIEPGDHLYSKDRVYVRDIFRWRKTGQHEEEYINPLTEKKETRTILDGRFEATGYIPKGLIEKASTNGVEIDENIFKNDGETEE